MKLKPGIKTSEFWTLILTQILLAAMAAVGKLDGELAVIIGSLLTAAYSFVRNNFKLSLGLKLRPGVTTSEFWSLCITGLLEMLLAAFDNVDGSWATLATTALAALYKAQRMSLTGMEVNQQAAAKK